MKPKWILLFACLCAGDSLAQEGAAAGAATADSVPATPAREFRVLDQEVIELGQRTVTYNLVETPILKPQPVPLPPPPARELTAAELAFVERMQRKEFKTLFLSATVYDHDVTELRWWEEGQQYRVFSNIDFNLIAGVGEIETDTAVYMVLMGIGNETRKDVAEWNAYVAAQGWPRPMKTEIPSARAFPAGRSTYFIAPEADFVAAWNRYVIERGLPREEMLTPQSPPPTGHLARSQVKPDTNRDPYAALDDLHAFYDANRQRLAEEYREREAARIAKEQWDKEHPPIPKSTVTNFFPIKSDSLRQGRAGERQ